MPKTLAAIQQQIGEDTKKWFPRTEDDIMYLAAALAGEVGEVCNELKKVHRGSKENTHVGTELADVLIYVCMLAETFDVDLTKEYNKKRKINAIRFGAD